ncbi:flagellar biosynthesis protein FlhB [Amorphus orientalis]|uniref:Flagellar biosynthetic protein FlhB n=1 Tax=Amorphus orientalis TaxID=649198 RepID=A0AAE3VSZ1_9HYPH|nr:flagellar biosynthesis protein FlhB [Amorphus orientalis]MDQ0317588.1 flagellar biosynthetic protein FlhB [Amorphus orientalis]
MAEDQDKDSKTEEASEKKISDALEKGNTPFSKEAPIFASLLGILLVMSFLLAEKVPELAIKLSRLFGEAGDMMIGDGSDAVVLLIDISKLMALFILPIVALLAVFGLFASLSQNAPRIVGERIRPQWNRISPASGWKRVFGVQGMVEFLRALAKFGLVGVITVMLLRNEIVGVINAVTTDPTLLPSQILSLSTRLVAAVCAATILLVAADLLWSRFKWRKDLRMSRKEQKDEMKQMEGDPLVKARMRSLARDRARHRMLTNVPEATLIITNPTHYAIALRYRQDEGGAPLVVAKGADLVALKIREIATQHEIPIIEDKPLARSLYDAVEVDQWIPPEFYTAVARIIYYIYSHPGGGRVEH